MKTEIKVHNAVKSICNGICIEQAKEIVEKLLHELPSELDTAVLYISYRDGEIYYSAEAGVTNEGENNE
jgi:hypothetical protein